MSDAGDFLARIVGALNEARIPHMVAGSVASTHHGVPRTTQDIDLVIEASGLALKAFVTSLSPAAYYVSEEAALDALRLQGMFNVIDLATGWKVDLILRKRRPFSVEEFRRRTPARLLGADVFVATPEDTILTKLEWASMSGSERQLRDVAGVVDVKRGELDVAYIERWAVELGVVEPWRKVLGSSH
ncbi:MAG: hypothetical protein ABI193_26575 [Minicystis sp.]